MIKNTYKSFFYIVGVLSFLLGIIGIFVPLLPTTPFIILSAYCFAKSSEKTYKKLLNNKWTGPIIISWKEHGAIPVYAKVFASIMITSSSFFILMTIKIVFLKALVLLLLTGLLFFVISRPSN